MQVWIRGPKRKFPTKRFFNNYTGYFIKEIPSDFLCLDALFQTLGMLLDFRKAKNTRLAACVFLPFTQVSHRIWMGFGGFVV